MYCPECGAESTRGLNYCNRCGANLSLPVDRATPPPVGNKFFTTLMFLGVTLVSIIIIVGMFVTVANYPVANLPPPYLTGVIIAACVAAFGTVAMLIQLLLRLTGLSHPNSRPEPRQILPERLAQELPPAPQVYGSITDNTTRNFPAREAARQKE